MKKEKPVEGVTVTVKGTKMMAATNADGEFTLYDVDDNVSLVFTHTSIEKQELKVKGRINLTVGVKKKVSALDEVQFVAYGKNSPRFQTGNVSTVKAADIEKQPINNPLLALQGRVSGLFIAQTNGFSGGAIKVRIQGQNSILNNNSPLYVVDGIPYVSDLPPGNNNIGPLGTSGETANYENTGTGSALSYINPSDIESIDILKDADATAIYGSRAANGAILITTKKGKAGKITFEINGQDGWGEMKRRIEMMNTHQYLEMRRKRFTTIRSRIRLLIIHQRFLMPPTSYFGILPDTQIGKTNFSVERLVLPI